MSIQVRILGVDALMQDLQALPVKMEASVLRQMSQIAYDRAQEGAGRHSKTGALDRFALPLGHNPPLPGRLKYLQLGGR